MKPPFVLVAGPLLVCAGLAWAAVPPAGETAAAHGHDGHQPHVEALPAAAVDAPSVRWTPDAPLRQGMRRMRDAVHSLEDHASVRLEPARVQALATEVDASVEFIFANCKLDTDPDVALHGVLARLMAGAQALHHDPADTSVLASMQAAIEDYPRLFNDPGFLDPAPGDEGRD